MHQPDTHPFNFLSTTHKRPHADNSHPPAIHVILFLIYCIYSGNGKLQRLPFLLLQSFSE